MPKTTVVRRLQRITNHDGGTLHFMIASSDRRHPPQFISSDQVPAFEGREGWFELEKIHAKPWPFWKVLRQVEAPTRAA
jgi:hypothetical protein